MAETNLGRYTLAQPVREDPLGTTYAATDTILHRSVWLRVFSPAEGSGAGEAERLAVLSGVFEEQTKLQAGLLFPGVPAVLDAGEVDGRRFVALERPDGRPLSEELELGGPMALPRAVGLARQLLGVLTVAHEKGAHHGSLATESILVTPTGRATVLWLCNPLPEQAAERDQAERSDLRAAARVLWACIVGPSAPMPLSPSDPRFAHAVPPGLRDALFAALVDAGPAEGAELLRAVSDPEVLRPAADVGEAHVTVPNHSSLAARLSLGVGLAFALAGALLQSWEAAALGLVVVTPSAFLGERMRGLIGIGFAAVTCLTALWVRGELW